MQPEGGQGRGGPKIENRADPPLPRDGTKSKIEVQSIGRVAHGRSWPPDDERWEDLESEIEIDPVWAEALDGLEGFSHVWVVWCLDRSPAGDALDTLRVHPQGRQEVPEVGLFATRSPRRPNPIAITAVRLLERRGNRLYVLGLDACVGSPVLDLKPYLRRGDLIPDATTAAWLERLWQIQDEERGKLIADSCKEVYGAKVQDRFK